MVPGWRRLTWIENDELEKFAYYREVAPLMTPWYVKRNDPLFKGIVSSHKN